MSAQTEPVLIAGRWQPSLETVKTFRAVDPALGEAFGPEFPTSGTADIEAALVAASDVAETLAATEPERIAAFLDAYAARIDANAQALAELAQRETGLSAQGRFLPAEIPRTSGQLRQAATAVRERSWTLPVIDTAAGLRAHLAPLGKPVLVFGPNNFPFAFNGIAGSDFASAIAARNPVIAKAHPSHPGTSKRLAELAHEALQEAGLPAQAVQMLYQFPRELGMKLAADARLGAIGFTGSRGAGLGLKAAADTAGVLFYGELSSINPVFLLPGILAAQAEALAKEFFASCTMGAGQFCTNPGVVVVIDGDGSDAFVAAAQQHFAGGAAGVLLSEGGLQHLQEAVAGLIGAGAQVLAGGRRGAEAGFRFQPTLLTVAGSRFLENARALQAEAFGPVSLLVRASDLNQAKAVARAFEGNLTGALYRAADGSDDAAWQALAPVLRARVGRLIANKMPTGVAVSPAQNHGGPFPSTTHPGFSAVGMPGTIRRFAALHSYDQLPDALLPLELRDRNAGGIWRQIDGRWSRGDVEAKA
ncbi:MAG TPA: aldehyde dehydrogenase (NADP(+)) [Pseudoxanthomonas sp.]|nr:aldehyde dehydrogenase (NADP(+)) [Pseudoxanthomonas sp.]